MRGLAALGIVGLGVLMAGCTWPGLESQAVEGLAFEAEISIGDPELNPFNPYLKAGADGKLYLSWTEAGEGGGNDGYVAELDQNGSPLSPRRFNQEAGEITGHGGENLPTFTVGRDSGITALWMTPGEKPRTGHQRAAHAAAGQPFDEAVTVNDDGLPINHAFSSITTAPDGRVMATWIDGRERVDQEDDRQTIYMAISEDGGRSFGANYKIAENVCPCCRTTTLVLDDEAVLVSHRNVTKPENVRDHVLVRSTDGGRTFSEPIVISNDGWTTPACPHAGPSLKADQHGMVHIAWWTGGRIPAEAGIYYTYSDDQGQNFAQRQLVAPAPSDIIQHAEVAIAQDGTVYVAWEGMVDEDTQIMLAYKSPDDDEWSEPVQISRASRSAGFPVMVIHEGRLFLAWSEQEGEASRVKLRSASLGERGETS